MFVSLLKKGVGGWGQSRDGQLLCNSFLCSPTCSFNMHITDTVNVMWKTLLSSVSNCLVYGLKFVTVLHRALGQTQRSP